DPSRPSASAAARGRCAASHRPESRAPRPAAPRDTRGASLRGTAPVRRSSFRVLLYVPAEVVGTGLAALLVLLGVFDLHFGEIEAHVLREALLTAAAARRVAGHENVLHRDLHVLERIFAGLADGDRALADMLAVGAVQHEVRRSEVDVLRDADVLEVRLAGAAAGARMERAGVGHAPAPCQEVHRVLALEGLVGGLALDALQ